MANLIYNVLDNSEETALNIEGIRGKVYDLPDTFNPRRSYYTGAIKEGNMLVFTCEIEGEIVAACYVSNTCDSLYIEHLFVLPKYQGRGLQLGRNLLQFIFDNKKLVEEYFNQQFDNSQLTPTSEKARAIYIKMGYYLDNKVLNIMRKNF